MGSGPAGLSAAGDLVRWGHAVTVFEALHEIGGVLVYGIPEFRLPKDIVRREVDVLRQMGIDFQTNVVIGKTVTIDELLGEEGYDAILIATGAGLPKFLGVPGEHLNGVYSANEFLTRVNLMRGYDPAYDEPVYDCRGKDVAVVGGGNTAMDAVRTACRLGARTSYLIYRRSENEMPARAEEVRHARGRGDCVPLPDQPGRVPRGRPGTAVRACGASGWELGAPDASGRCAAAPIEGSEFEMPIQMAVIALGTEAPTRSSSPRRPTCRPTARATSRPTRRRWRPRSPACSRRATSSPAPRP